MRAWNQSRVRRTHPFQVEEMESALSDAESAHVQASFFTKQNRYLIPDTAFSIPVTVTRNELTTLINQLLDDKDARNKEFDFLINGELLRGTLENHIAERSIPIEHVIEIEYSERNPPPSLSEVVEHKDWVSCVHCCNEFILTGCYDGVVRIWTHDGQLVHVATGHSAPVKDVKWVTTGDSPVFLSASQDQHVHLWGIPSGGDQGCVALLHQCKGHARSVEGIAVSPDHTKFCSVSWDKMLKVWSAVPDLDTVDDDVADDSTDLPAKKRKKLARPSSSSSRQPSTRTPLMTLSGHAQPVSSVVWAGPEEVASAAWDHSIRLWDLESGVNKSTLTGSKVFHCIDWSALSQLVASASSDKFVRIWDTRQSESSVIQCTLCSHQAWVVAVQWSPESEHQLISGSYDSTLRLWDTRSPKLPLFTIAAHEGKVLGLDWTLPKVLASGGTDNKLRTYSF